MPQDNPFSKYAQPSGGRSGVVISDPYKATDERRKDQSQQFDARRVELSAADNERARETTRLDNPRKLRDDFQRIPEVLKYKIALAQGQRALGTAATPQGDLALTYAIAQAMDPMGSVREGDQASIASTQPALAGLIEKIKKNFGMDGSGAYTPEARKALRREVFSIIAAYKPLYDARRADAADFAKRAGVDPAEVLGRDDTTIYAPSFREYGEKNGDDGTISRIVGGEPIKGAAIPVAPDERGLAGRGATEAAGTPIPEAMQQDYFRYINQNWGKLDPQAFAEFRAGLDAKYGVGEPSIEGYRSDAEKLNAIALKGQGPEVVGRIQPADRKLGLDQFRNDMISSPVGAFVAGGLNMGGLGIPSAIAGDQYNDLRKEYPKSVLAGELTGGVIGANKFGGLVRGVGKAAEARGASTVANILAKPLTSDVLYGTVTGANDAIGRGDSVVAGALTGGVGGVVGNKLGTAVGRAFPGKAAVRELDATVPTSDELKTLAGDLYSQAEAKGLIAAPADTLALADTTKNILMNEGRLSPSGRLTDVQPKVAEAFKLIDDYADQPMTPTQIQTVRGVIADGGASTDAGERRISRLLLDNFDNWADATNPELASGLRDARGVSSRYLQGDKIASMRDLAEPGAGQYTQSGMGNALRTQYRGLDRAITRGRENFAPNVEDAVRDVARGDPLRNSLRYVGKLAPTGQMGMYGTLGATVAGTGAAGPVGGAVPVALALLGTGARRLEMGLADRAATVAENSAYGGPDYTTALTQMLSDAGTVGGSTATGAISGAEPTAQDLIARLLLNPDRSAGQVSFR